MLIVALLLPLLAAIAAWFLDRVVPTRHIGYVAIGTLFISAWVATSNAGGAMDENQRFHHHPHVTF